MITGIDHIVIAAPIVGAGDRDLARARIQLWSRAGGILTAPTTR